MAELTLHIDDEVNSTQVIFYEIDPLLFKKIEKTQNNDLFISPKWKNAILEMALKSFIISKLEHQMSESWKWIARHAFETICKFDRLKN